MHNHTLKWVDIAIANFKSNLLGVYHKIKKVNIFRDTSTNFAVRYFGEKLFDRLIITETNTQWQVSR